MTKRLKGQPAKRGTAPSPAELPAARMLPLSSLKPNAANPRTVKDSRFRALVKSIQTFPEMLRIRPLVVDADMVILGGNVRFRACLEAGLTEAPVIVADTLTAAQQREFIVKDNLPAGEWDWAALQDDYAAQDLLAWGVELPFAPNLAPVAGLPAVLPEDVERTRKQLAEQFDKSDVTVDVTCPNCAHEFTVSG